MTDADASGEIAATAPHCGVCAHVEFLADWDRTPYCPLTGRIVEISVGDVCEAFER